jgi:NADH-quinone oxidoreductase subunit G
LAAVAGTETVTINVNGIDLEVPKGELIVESVKKLGLEIPIFCYHPRMRAVGMCRMCIVEVGFTQPDGSVRKMPKPQAACTLPADNGMVIYTDTEMVHRDRRGVIEFLLINHPLDCPICDRGGECPLQNNTLFYGPSTSRFIELKRHLPKAFPLSKYVTLDLERCIQCGRCVRFTEEISGDGDLAFRFRGAQMQPSTFQLTEFESKFSGNTIEICPVGALTSARYRFRARPWDLETRPAICTICSNGCNVWFDYRVGRMVRINGRTNEAVNEEWTCDRGKFGHDWYNSDDRIRHPLVRRGDRLEQATWAEAFDAILEGFRNAVAPGVVRVEAEEPIAVGAGVGAASDAPPRESGRHEDPRNRVAGLAGGMASNEDLYLFQKLFRTRFQSNNLDHRFTRHLQRAEERIDRKLDIPHVGSTMRSYESVRAALIFGTSLADEEPILFLRLRKVWFNFSARIVVAHHEPTDVDDFAAVVLRYRQGSEALVAAGLEAAMLGVAGEKSDGPTPEQVEEGSGVPAEMLRSAAEILAGSQAPVVTTYSLLNAPQAQEALEALARVSQAANGPFNLYGLESSDQGADLLGILPDMLPGGRLISEGDARAAEGMNTRDILDACANGELDALWLLDVDPTERWNDHDAAVAALENVPFLVYQGRLACEAMHYASVVLPMTAPAETDGSYTNVEGRVQRFKLVIQPAADEKPAWKVFTELNLRIIPEPPFFNAGEVMEEIAREAPMFGSATYDHLEGEGQLVIGGQTEQV